MSKTIEQLQREFLEYLEIEKGAALRTIENYQHTIARFFEFGASLPADRRVTTAADITDETVREFRLWMNRQKVRPINGVAATMSKKTQNHYLTALRVFLKFLAKRGISSLASDRIDLAKIPERTIDLITPAELTRLLDAPKGNDIKSLRDKAILETLFSTGLRVSELCSLPRDISINSEELSIRGKGGKVRVVFISQRARAALQKYLDARDDMEEGLFVRLSNNRTMEIKSDKSRRSGRDSDQSVGKKYTGKKYDNLDRHSIEHIVKRYAIMAGISKKVTPHVIRHCFATDLLSNGADIRSVQVMLGHSNIATTQIYTHVTDKQLLNIHKKFHGKSAE